MPKKMFATRTLCSLMRTSRGEMMQALIHRMKQHGLTVMEDTEYRRRMRANFFSSSKKYYILKDNDQLDDYLTCSFDSTSGKIRLETYISAFDFEMSEWVDGNLDETLADVLLDKLQNRTVVYVCGVKDGMLQMHSFCIESKLSEKELLPAVSEALCTELGAAYCDGFELCQIEFWHCYEYRIMQFNAINMFDKDYLDHYVRCFSESFSAEFSHKTTFAGGMMLHFINRKQDKVIFCLCLTPHQYTLRFPQTEKYSVSIYHPSYFFSENLNERSFARALDFTKQILN